MKGNKIMNKTEKIVEKTLKIIASCVIMEHIQVAEKYVDLAIKQILKKHTSKNYRYAATMLIALHYQTIPIIKQTIFNFERRY